MNLGEMRNLDYWIAVNILGYEELLVNGLGCLFKDGQGILQLPRFSMDIGEAWKVVEKLRELTQINEIRIAWDAEESRWGCTINYEVIDGVGGETIYYEDEAWCFDDSAALAICKVTKEFAEISFGTIRDNQ